MLYAIDASGSRIPASPNQQAFCPGCRAGVISKCGEINQWHWAHRSGTECDLWHEPETRWHTGWKFRFAENCREVVIGEHRADVKATEKHTSQSCVIELQHSPIDYEQIREREQYYGSMVWLIDGIGFKDNFEFGRESRINGGATLEAPFRLKWFRKSWSASRRRLYLDFGDRLWLLTEMNSEGRGKAQSWTYHEFLAQFTEAFGRDVPVTWMTTGRSGNYIYRFGLGHVLVTRAPRSKLRNRYVRGTWAF